MDWTVRLEWFTGKQHGPVVVLSLCFSKTFKVVSSNRTLFPVDPQKKIMDQELKTEITTKGDYRGIVAVCASYTVVSLEKKSYLKTCLRTD